MIFSQSIGNQSGMVPGPSGHQKTSFWMGSKLPDPWKNSKNDKLKKSKISWKTQAFDDFLDLIFSNFPCWRMCCLAAGLEGTFTWLLEQILAQSNYRTCWIFGSTSVQILVALSILFGEYLAIYPTDLDDFQNVPRHFITLEACSLRLVTALMYIWVLVWSTLLDFDPGMAMMEKHPNYGNLYN